MNLSRGEMAKIVFTEQELRNVDFALPIEWTRAFADLHGEQASIFYWVMDYNNPKYNPFGRVINMAEKYVDMQMEALIEANVLNKNTALSVSDLIKYLLIPKYGPYVKKVESTEQLDTLTIEWLNERHVCQG